MPEFITTRETRSAARELKFVVDPDTAGRIQEWARAALEPDPYAAGGCGDEYSTTTLYLDTPALDVVHRRASYGRSKLRIRRYGEMDVVYLERKLRSAVLLSKRRTAVPMDDLSRLEWESPDESWAGTWFKRRIDLRGVRPVAQVSYRRTARVGASVWGAMRLTIDDAIVGRPAAGFRFQAGTTVPVLEGGRILELKFRREMPGLFKQLVESFALEPAPVSKYRLTSARLGLVDEDASTPGLVEVRSA